MSRGYFGIGAFNPKTEENIGMLFRTAYLYGASYIFTIGARYRDHAADTPKAYRHIPLFKHEDITSFLLNVPKDCKVVGVELDDRSEDLRYFKHPERVVYLLGAEDYGIPKQVLSYMDHVIQIPSMKDISMNMAVAGSLVMYDRFAKTN